MKIFVIPFTLSISVDIFNIIYRVPIIQPDFTCVFDKKRRKREDEFSNFDSIFEDGDTESDPSVGDQYPKPYCNCVQSK